MRLILMIGLLFSSALYAFEPENCAKNTWLKYGILRQYDINYSSINFISSRTSAREGYFNTSSVSTSQQTTMAVDPGISTGNTYSHTQFTSSFGACSAQAKNDRWIERETFLVENFESLRIEIAKGDGEFLRTFSQLSGCSSPRSLSQELKQNFEALYASDPWVLSPRVDDLIAKNPRLSRDCQIEYVGPRNLSTANIPTQDKIQ